MIVLDTNVLSELVRSRPDPRVVDWVEAHRGETVTTSVTAWELRYGAARLPSGQRRSRLVDDVERMIAGLGPLMLVFDEAAARHAAELRVRREGEGRPISMPDVMIAGMCAAHGASLATRNVHDFGDLGIEVIDPWA